MFSQKPWAGLEITPSQVRMVVLSKRAGNTTVLSAQKTDLSEGSVSTNYASLNIPDARLADAVRGCLQGISPVEVRRAALSLPDEIFRVQTLEFDRLPGKSTERERLIRWRCEKSAAFDVSETVLRYQVVGHSDSGVTALACFAKKDVLAQYEETLLGLGLEPWSIGLSSLSTLNFYSAYMSQKSAVSAVAHLTDEWFTMIITENGGVRFYRSKEVKRGGAHEVRSRLAREIEDSLHFFTHMDRKQQIAVDNLFLSGDSALLSEVGEELSTMPSLTVEILSPLAVFPSSDAVGAEMAAAWGAGSMI